MSTPPTTSLPLSTDPSVQEAKPAGASAVAPPKPAEPPDKRPGLEEGRRPEVRNEALDRVAASLRSAYESTVTEAVPDSILDLLRQLD